MASAVAEYVSPKLGQWVGTVQKNIIGFPIDYMWEWSTGRCTVVTQLPNRSKELEKRGATL